jgi:hypothetical protein
MLWTAATALHGGPGELTPQARQIAQHLINGVLTAATAGGFMHADVLETLLSRCVVSERTTLMAREACAAAGTEALQTVFGKLGLLDVTAWPA